MKNIFQLAFYRFRKDKRQYILLMIILSLTAIITNLAFTLVMNVEAAYNQVSSTLNTANIYITIPAQEDDKLYYDDIKKINGVSDVEIREGILNSAVAKDFLDTDFEMQTVFYNVSDKNKMNKLDIVEARKNEKQNGIYLPLYITELGEYTTNGDITYLVNGVSYTWPVNAKIQEMQYGNYGSGTIGVYLSNSEYQKLKLANNKHIVSVYSIQINEDAKSSELTKRVNDYFYDKNITVLQSNYDEANRQVRTLFTNIVVMALFSFSLIVLLVSLSLSKFKISNTIEMETSNLGVLKGLGYSSKSIISTLVLPYLFIATVALIIGISCSILLLPSISDIIGFQAGMSMHIGVNTLAIILTLVILIGMSGLFSYIGARKIKKIQAVIAIREGTMGNAKRRNILILIVLCFMSVLMSFATTMFYNTVVKTENFSTSVSEEMPSAIVYANENRGGTLKRKLSSMDGVEHVMYYSQEKVEINGNNVIAFVSEDFDKTANDLSYKGRHPKNENEIAIGNTLVTQDAYTIGDTIKVKVKDKQHTYTIVGFVQSVNFQGNIIELTNTGYTKLSEKKDYTTLNVYMKENVNVDNFINDATKNHGTFIKKAINYNKLAETTSGMYITVMKVMIIFISIMIILIIWLVLYIIIRSLIIQQRKELGIYKAIGYTNRQLRLHFMNRFLPISLIAIFVSVLLGIFYMEVIYTILFQSLGAIKNNLETPIVVLLIGGGILAIQTFSISFLLTRPIKKISVCELINE